MCTHTQHIHTHIYTTHTKKKWKEKKQASRSERAPDGLHTTPHTHARAQATWVHTTPPMLSGSLMLTPRLFPTDSLRFTHEHTLANPHSRRRVRRLTLIHTHTCSFTPLLTPWTHSHPACQTRLALTVTVMVTTVKLARSILN